jgi:hypothetical protein
MASDSPTKVREAAQQARPLGALIALIEAELSSAAKEALR